MEVPLLERLESPRKIFRRWEAGEIKREELQERLAEHQRAILAEVEESRLNPVASYIESLLTKRAALKLIHQHGEAGVREMLVALSEIEGFRLAAYLWNASHWDVPLHCFLRQKRAPVFRIREMWIKSDRGEMQVQHGPPEKVVREHFRFERHWRGHLEVVERRVM